MVNYRPILILLGICVILIGGLSVWSTQGSAPEEQKLVEEVAPIESPLTPVEQEITKPEITNIMNPIAVLETNKGTIEIELFKDTMPITAGNFEKLIGEGFYNGTFGVHRFAQCPAHHSSICQI